MRDLMGMMGKVKEMQEKMASMQEEVERLEDHARVVRQPPHDAHVVAAIVGDPELPQPRKECVEFRDVPLAGFARPHLLPQLSSVWVIVIWKSMVVSPFVFPCSYVIKSIGILI